MIFTWGVLATVVSSVVASSLYLGLVHPEAADVLWDWNPVGGFAVFAVIVVGSAFSLIVDVRCMTMRRWNLVLFRIVLVGVAKIAAALPIGGQSSNRALLAVPVPRRHRSPCRGILGVFMHPPDHRLAATRSGPRRATARPPCGTRPSTTCRRSPTRRRTSPSR